MPIASLISFSEKVYKNDQRKAILIRELNEPIKKKCENSNNLFIKDTYTCEGDRDLDLLKKTLLKFDSSSYKRSYQQKEVHEAYIKACLPQLYGEHFGKNVQRLMEDFETDTISSQVMVTMPRRMGKTVSTAQFAGSYMFSQPGAEVIVYSPCRRASSMFLSVLERMVRIIIPADAKISRNAENFVIMSIDGKTLSSCHSYPSKVDVSKKKIFLGGESLKKNYGGSLLGGSIFFFIYITKPRVGLFFFFYKRIYKNLSLLLFFMLSQKVSFYYKKFFYNNDIFLYKTIF